MSSAALSDDERRVLCEAEARLLDLSVEQRPLLTLARSIKALAPDAEAVVTEWSREGMGRGLFFTGDPRIQHVRDHPPAHKWQPVYAGYRRDGRDRAQHRAVDFVTAIGGDRERMETYRKLVYASLGVGDQLRVLVGEPGEGPITCCMVFATSPELKRPRELALLQGLVPALRDAVAAYRALGAVLGTLAEAAQALEAFDEPAWLCSERGRLLHRNQAAGQVGPSTPACVLASARAPGDVVLPCTTTRRLFLADGAAVLVLPRRGAIRDEASTPVQKSGAFGDVLSPTLARVAERMVAGQTDLQIARALGRPLATVRTYAVRIYRRLGIHARSELVNLGRVRARR